MNWRNWLPWLLLLVLGLAGLWQQVVHETAPVQGATSEFPPPVRVAPGLEPSISGIPSLPNATVRAMNHGGKPPAAPDHDDPLAAMMRRDFDGLTVTTHPDGRRSVHLGGRFQHVTRLITAADGETHIHCISSHEELLESVATPVIEPEPSHVPATVDF